MKLDGQAGEAARSSNPFVWIRDALDRANQAINRSLGIIDHVVGRGNHIAEGVDVAKIVSQAWKRLDFGHCFAGVEGWICA